MLWSCNDLLHWFSQKVLKLNVEIWTCDRLHYCLLVYKVIWLLMGFTMKDATTHFLLIQSI